MGYDMYATDDALSSTKEGYFRLNIWGMSEVRSFLRTIGALELRILPFPPEHQDFLTWAPPAPQGICLHKLQDNSGWLVTKQEIESALRIYDQAILDNATYLADSSVKLEGFEAAAVDYVRQQHGEEAVWPAAASSDLKIYTVVDHLAENPYISNFMDWMKNCGEFTVH